MRKPAHASNGAPQLKATVFEKGKRHALFEVTGTDPSAMAKAVATHKAIGEDERKHVRPKVRSALQAFIDRAVPNMTNIQQDIGGRRVRIEQTA